MKIPILTTAGAPQEQRTFSPLSPTTYAAVGEAGRELGAAIGNVGDLAVRVKTALDTATLAKAETGADVHFKGFVDSLSDGKNPDNGDPSTYQQRWQDAQAGFTDQMANDNGVKTLSMQARLQYQTSMERWKMTTTQAVGHLATEKALQNAVGDMKTGYEYDLMDGSPEAQERARVKVENLMNTGLLNPIEGKEMVAQIPIKAEYNQAVQMMSRDYKAGGGPIVLENALKETNADGSFKFYPHVVGQHREALTFDAYRNARGLQAQVAAKYAVKGQDGEQIDPNEVAEDLRFGAISPAAAKALLKPEKNYDPDSFATISTAISNADLSHDTDHTKEANLRAMINDEHNHLDAPSLTRLNEMLKESLNPKASVNTPVAKDLFQDAERERAAGVFLPRAMTSRKIPSGHWFTSDKTEQVMGAEADVGKKGEVAHWRETAPADIRAAEAKHYNDYLTKMRGFFSNYARDHGGKEPTDVEANEYSQQLKRPYVMEAVTAAITGSPATKAATVPTQAGKRVTQNGLTYELGADGKWNQVK